MATIHYARLLVDNGYYEYAERLLGDGVASEFVPAYFWLAWFRYEDSERDGVRREYRHLLEHAAAQGHPGAQLMLASHMVRGKFGFRQTLPGLVLVFRSACKHALQGARSEVPPGIERHPLTGLQP